MAQEDKERRNISCGCDALP